jgi:hypothetical protein
MTELLVELLQPKRRTGVVDVGANPITDAPPYAPMLQRRIATLVGFEPQAEGLAALNLRKSDLETYLPYALGDGKPGTLKLCHAPGMSSLLTPNPQVLDCLALYSIFGMVVGEMALETRRLDDIAEIGALDFLTCRARSLRCSRAAGCASPARSQCKPKSASCHSTRTSRCTATSTASFARSA